MGEPTFWDDPDQAQKITQELNGVKAGVDKYKNILHKCRFYGKWAWKIKMKLFAMM